MGSKGSVQRAIALHQRGRLGKAEKLYRRILDSAPGHPDASHFLGVLLHQRGRSAEGLEHLRRAVEAAPGYLDAHNNLGNVLKEVGRFDDAAQAYRRALELAPEHLGALNNLGIVERSRRRFADAARLFERAIAVDPTKPYVWVNYGNALTDAGRTEEAVAAYRKGIALEPESDAGYFGLGRLFFKADRFEDAAAVYGEWLEHDPGNPVAIHMMAACSGIGVPARASDDFVRTTFDEFAGSFDQKLEKLRYRAPGLIADALDRVSLPGGDLVVLDAGCGTGLCGPMVRGMAQRLVGVDLSPAMVEKARGRELYDELVVGELTEYLEGLGAEFDLIVSADTLVYFGSLERVLRAAFDALRQGGVLAFTLETSNSESTREFTLQPHGRYSHSRQYVESKLEALGFVLRSLDFAHLRLESGKPVDGLVVVASRPEPG